MSPGEDQGQAGLLLAMAEQWLGAWRFAAALSWTSAASLVQLTDPQRVRRDWSTNLTGMMDRTLRSPEFLRLMACNLRAMADAAQFTSKLRPRYER
jgi:hypothetical protein